MSAKLARRRVRVCNVERTHFALRLCTAVALLLKDKPRLVGIGTTSSNGACEDDAVAAVAVVSHAIQPGRGAMVRRSEKPALALV